jgi:PIN domain nuclease of toxin-antitoxin system
VGPFAVGFHGFPRYTGDIDILVRPTEENARRVPAANPKNELYLSPDSIWEAHHLERREIAIEECFTEWFNQVFEKAPLREAPFNFAVAPESCRIELPQSDLRDLFLAATASVFDHAGHGRFPVLWDAIG